MLELAKPRRTAQGRSITGNPTARHRDRSGPNEPKPSCAGVSLSSVAVTEYRRGEELNLELSWLLPETLATSYGLRMAGDNLAHRSL